MKYHNLSCKLNQTMHKKIKNIMKKYSNSDKNAIKGSCGEVIFWQLYKNQIEHWTIFLDKQYYWYDFCMKDEQKIDVKTIYPTDNRIYINNKWEDHPSKFVIILFNPDTKVGQYLCCFDYQLFIKYKKEDQNGLSYIDRQLIQTWEFQQ